VLQVVDFYEYYKGQMEAWDGPALLLFRYGAAHQTRVR
jgi:glutamate synthase domain-containing protein 1